MEDEWIPAIEQEAIGEGRDDFLGGEFRPIGDETVGFQPDRPGCSNLIALIGTLVLGELVYRRLNRRDKSKHLRNCPFGDFAKVRSAAVASAKGVFN